MTRFVYSYLMMKIHRACFGWVVVTALGMAFSGTSPAQQPATGAPADVNGAAAGDPSGAVLTDAVEMAKGGDFDGALGKVNGVLKADPKNLNGYILRAAIYSQKKMWAQAQQDFITALQIDPKSVRVKFNLAEIQFDQKNYDVARTGFAELQKNDNMGDLAVYKVFLCDLLGGHEAVAASELDALNQAGTNPSYYYGNVAWAVVHHKTEEARSWLTSAVNIYSPQKNNIYAESLKELGFLPLPPSAPAL
jgi:Tfp pilus assembly protein PilF